MRSILVVTLLSSAVSGCTIKLPRLTSSRSIHDDTRSRATATITPQINLGISNTVVSSNGTACSPVTLGKGPVPSPDNESAFNNSPEITAEAINASTPVGYQLTFMNLRASSNAGAYLGYFRLDSYDTTACASNCTAKNECESFNIYFERDPSVNIGDGCPNSPSTTNIKCVMWAAPVIVDNTDNIGSTIYNFKVVIAGSNGYVNSGTNFQNGTTTGANINSTAPATSAIVPTALLLMVAFIMLFL